MLSSSSKLQKVRGSPLSVSSCGEVLLCVHRDDLITQKTHGAVSAADSQNVGADWKMHLLTSLQKPAATSFSGRLR